ncbi:MAG TPA: metal-dependent transcriptional regulator [Cyclobacteriaceae bacterium]|nr:metal-dependent transcriptional regulator [Cyclobacteriaceae bacterium]HRK54466.1 metal-dependent transcriptional regulator [Cyclobacteriaceae bacterium]
MNSLTEENYLKALLALSVTSDEVSVNDLAKHLAIKMPTVTSMMKKLAAKRLVQYESYKPIKLTKKGRQEAAGIVRKHRLTEMFLVDKMGFGWEQVHDIAEQIEHIKSPAFFDKMDELLGFPTLDPHGSPIPDKTGKIEWKHYEKLSDCKPGDKVTLSAVLNSSSDFLKFLNSRDLKLGVNLKIDSIEPFDKTITISIGKRKEVLSNLVCEKLLVEKVT